ncbi:MAG TPA: host attachment protein, partial [Holophagaceae bacterium]
TAFAHPGSRAHVQDMVSDRPGRRSDTTPGHRSGLSPELEPKEVEALKFACGLASELKRGLNRHAYDELVLAAPPHFLGMMRQCLDGQVASRLATTFDKDFTTLPVREIEQRIYAFRR